MHCIKDNRYGSYVGFVGDGMFGDDEGNTDYADRIGQCASFSV